jgi:ribonuclease E
MKGPSHMVDETTPSAPDSAAGTDATKARPRRRAASRPAGPPPADATDSASPADSAAVKKTAAKKTAAKKTAAKKVAAKKVAAKKTAAKATEEKATEKKATEKKATEKKSAAKKTTAKKASASKSPVVPAVPLFQAPEPIASTVTSTARKSSRASKAAGEDHKVPADAPAPDDSVDPSAGTDEGDSATSRRRRRRGGRGRRSVDGASSTHEADDAADSAETAEVAAGDDDPPGDSSEDGEASTSSRRRRRRRRRGQDASVEPDDPAHTVVRVREPRSRGGDVSSVKGSTRLEAKRQRRRDGRDAGRRRAPILTEAEFLARRESVERVMAVRQHEGRVQIAVLEDGVLVEHYVDQGVSSSMVGNVYLGRVQNVLPSMEAAFVDIGRGRNGVLYAGEVNWDAAGLEGQPKRIELALKSGDPIMVQVTKDPVGQKGARLTSQISLPGRFLVLVPDGSMTGISRKLPDTERSRLKAILKKVVPEGAGVIIRTAAEGASEEEIGRDIQRLQSQWEELQAKAASATPPAVVSAEPDLAIKVIRDIFNEDFTRMIVSGSALRAEVDEYVSAVAPDLAERIESWVDTQDLFAKLRIDEQLTKALDRKVWLPSGGSLVIDRTEAMTVVDVNTGKFTGQGGNLEETVTKNNLEAAEEIVRQLRLRDIGGIIVVDFIDMVLESNRDLVLRRLVECLGRDRTKHQVAEVTSLGLVQMTRKRIGQGLLEAFSTTCDSCGGRGLHVSLTPSTSPGQSGAPSAKAGRRRGKGVDPADVIARSLESESTEPPSVAEPVEEAGELVVAEVFAGE